MKDTKVVITYGVPTVHVGDTPPEKTLEQSHPLEKVNQWLVHFLKEAGLTGKFEFHLCFLPKGKPSMRMASFRYLHQKRAYNGMRGVGWIRLVENEDAVGFRFSIPSDDGVTIPAKLLLMREMARRLNTECEGRYYSPTRALEREVVRLREKIERIKKVKTSKESVVKQAEVRLSEAKQSLADISAEIVTLTEQLDRIQQ